MRITRENKHTSMQYWDGQWCTLEKIERKFWKNRSFSQKLRTFPRQLAFLKIRGLALNLSTFGKYFKRHRTAQNWGNNYTNPQKCTSRNRHRGLVHYLCVQNRRPPRYNHTPQLDLLPSHIFPAKWRLGVFKITLFVILPMYFGLGISMTPILLWFFSAFLHFYYWENRFFNFHYILYKFIYSLTVKNSKSGQKSSFLGEKWMHFWCALLVLVRNEYFRAFCKFPKKVKMTFFAIMRSF